MAVWVENKSPAVPLSVKGGSRRPHYVFARFCPSLREPAAGQLQPGSLHPCRTTTPRRIPFPPYSRRDSGYVAEPRLTFKERGGWVGIFGPHRPHFDIPKIRGFFQAA
jgi:hypothetical protein